MSSALKRVTEVYLKAKHYLFTHNVFCSLYHFRLWNDVSLHSSAERRFCHTIINYAQTSLGLHSCKVRKRYWLQRWLSATERFKDDCCRLLADPQHGRHLKDSGFGWPNLPLPFGCFTEAVCCWLSDSCSTTQAFVIWCESCNRPFFALCWMRGFLGTLCCQASQGQHRLEMMEF